MNNFIELTVIGNHFDRKKLLVNIDAIRSISPRDDPPAYNIKGALVDLEGLKHPIGCDENYSEIIKLTKKADAANIDSSEISTDGAGNHSG